MCVAAIAWDIHPEFVLIAIGNRDEFHTRPSAPLAPWDDGSGIIAGRDLQAGGTWLGVSDAGRFALLTNFRDPENFRSGRPSRGQVVRQVLAGQRPQQMEKMNPFNLFYADGAAAWSLSNSAGLHRQLITPGIKGLSNGPLERPWPKTRQLCGALGQWVDGQAGNPSALFDALREETPVPTEPMPHDGPQPAYAPVFIRNPDYGTRCSTVVLIGRNGDGRVIERSFDPDGKLTDEQDLAFDWPVKTAGEGLRA
jgi:uncharacterized protein with NRDE domain